MPEFEDELIGWAGCPPDLFLDGKPNYPVTKSFGDTTINPLNFERETRAYLEAHEDIIRNAQSDGLDVLARETVGGGELIIGPRIALNTKAVGAITLFEYQNSPEPSR